MDTVFCTYKNLRQVSAFVPDLEGMYESLSQIQIRGYEIHMGESAGCGDSECVTTNESVLGTYIHGIFDSPEFTARLLKILYDKKGIRREIPKIESAEVTREKELDKLADVLRQSLDLEMIYSIMQG